MKPQHKYLIPGILTGEERTVALLCPQLIRVECPRQCICFVGFYDGGLTSHVSWTHQIGIDFGEKKDKKGGKFGLPFAMTRTRGDKYDDGKDIGD